MPRAGLLHPGCAEYNAVHSHTRARWAVTAASGKCPIRPRTAALRPLGTPRGREAAPGTLEPPQTAPRPPEALPLSPPPRNHRLGGFQTSSLPARRTVRSASATTDCAPRTGGEGRRMRQTTLSALCRLRWRPFGLGDSHARVYRRLTGRPVRRPSRRPGAVRKQAKPPDVDTTNAATADTSERPSRRQSHPENGDREVTHGPELLRVRTPCPHRSQFGHAAHERSDGGRPAGCDTR